MVKLSKLNKYLDAVTFDTGSTLIIVSLVRDEDSNLLIGYTQRKSYIQESK